MKKNRCIEECLDACLERSKKKGLRDISDCVQRCVRQCQKENPTIWLNPRAFRKHQIVNVWLLGERERRRHGLSTSTTHFINLIPRNSRANFLLTLLLFFDLGRGGRRSAGRQTDGTYVQSIDIKFGPLLSPRKGCGLFSSGGRCLSLFFHLLFRNIR